MPATTTKNGFYSKSKAEGFTLVELLLVVAIIGTLSGVLLSTINYTQHQKNANDSLMRANMTKLITGLETYRTVEGKYPTDANADGSPADDALISNYIRGGWLNDEPKGAVYKYYVNGARDFTGILVTENTGKVLKYTSDWAQIKECAGNASVNDNTCL